MRTRPSAHNRRDIAARPRGGPFVRPFFMPSSHLRYTCPHAKEESMDLNLRPILPWEPRVAEDCNAPYNLREIDGYRTWRALGEQVRARAKQHGVPCPETEEELEAEFQRLAAHYQKEKVLHAAYAAGRSKPS